MRNNKYFLMKAMLLILLWTDGASFSIAAEEAVRIHDPDVLEAGALLFRKNCAVCHGWNAEGTVKNWQETNADGKYPPPPLNGTAHAWHHSVEVLARTIKNGTEKIGGTMPAWRDKLSDEEISNLIEWITSLWPDEIYQVWYEQNHPDQKSANEAFIQPLKQD